VAEKTRVDASSFLEGGGFETKTKERREERHLMWEWVGKDGRKKGDNGYLCREKEESSLRRLGIPGGRDQSIRDTWESEGKIPAIQKRLRERS